MPSRKRAAKFIKRPLVHISAFVLPGLVIGAILTFVSVAEWIRVPQAPGWSKEFPEPPAHDPTKPTAAVLVSNRGAESTDLLAPYEILATSGVLNVYTVAPKREVSPILFGAYVLPHFSFEGLERRLGDPPDLILIPNIPDPEDSTIVSWVERNAATSTLVVSVCEGVRVLAAAGLLHNRKASSHFMSLGQLARDYPTTTWTRGVRYVEDGNVITSAGVTASIDATLHALRRIAGLQIAQQTAERLGYQMELHPREVDPFDLRLADFASLFMTAGYKWNKTNSGVLLFDGIGEVELGSVLDLYPRVFDGSVATIAPLRKPIRSKNGLDLLPAWTFEDAPDVEDLVIPGETPWRDPTYATQNWIASEGIELQRPHAPGEEDIGSDEPRFAYDVVVQEIASRRGRAVARGVAKWVEYPVEHIQLSGSAWPFPLFVIPLGLGTAGVVLGRWVGTNRLRARGQHR